MSCLQIIPTQPPHPGLTFDLFQFAKRSKAVSAESGIAFSDYGRMHSFGIKGKRRQREFAPAFANNSEQLRKVLAVSAFRYCRGGRAPFPEGITLAELRSMADAKFNQWQSRRLDNFPAVEQEMVRRHIRSVERAGGYLHLHAAVAYRSWKLGYTSGQVASELQMTAPGVRLVLYRLSKIAKSLGFETAKTGKWLGKSNVRQPHVTKLPPGPELIRLHESKAYWTLARLAKRFGVRRDTVRDAYRRAKNSTKELPQS